MSGVSASQGDKIVARQLAKYSLHLLGVQERQTGKGWHCTSMGYTKYCLWKKENNLELWIRCTLH